MIYAKDDVEFDATLAEMQKLVNGLGYDQVLEVDLNNAADKAAAIKELLK